MECKSIERGFLERIGLSAAPPVASRGKRESAMPAAKFDIGTGWPRFTGPLDDAIRTRPDPGLFSTRADVHCRGCGGHHGHLFDDGPPPTGQRYCMNGVALNFIPASGSGNQA